MRVRNNTLEVKIPPQVVIRAPRPNDIKNSKFYAELNDCIADF